MFATFGGTVSATNVVTDNLATTVMETCAATATVMEIDERGHPRFELLASSLEQRETCDAALQPGYLLNFGAESCGEFDENLRAALVTVLFQAIGAEK